ncbi:ATP-grasp domain-containing protein [Oleiharenicola sp. Vm1]|uniref:ATP-grasp domain-containing protein n=1 Tax=Oleiharenicola sp. Vm1 TaxID=3398393 RepID=UPI0039F5974C
MSQPRTILCLASFHKGFEFLREAKAQGWIVLLLTSKSLEHEEWPREAIDEIFYMPDVDKVWNRADVIKGVSYLARRRRIDRLVALDDFDVETAAALREHLRIPGMGETTARYFRDKLAMRLKAREAGIPVPEFTHVANYDDVRAFMARVPGPGCSSPASPPRRWASTGSSGPTTSGRNSTHSVTSSRSTCSRPSCPAASTTSTASSTTARWSSPSPAATAPRRSR